MRRLILALAALSAASCNGPKPTDQDAANAAQALLNDQIAASQASTPQFPDLDSDEYCARIAAGAGAPNIEKGCKEQEAAAKKEAMAMTVPAITVSYCTQSAKMAGGSYQIYKLCIAKEKASAKPL